MKPEQGWCVKNKNDEFLLMTMGYDQQHSTRLAERACRKAWEELSAEPYLWQCVKVEVREVENEG